MGLLGVWKLSPEEYRTKLCPNTSHCPYFERGECDFAHDMTEIRTREMNIAAPVKKKRKSIKSFEVRSEQRRTSPRKTNIKVAEVQDRDPQPRSPRSPGSPARRFSVSARRFSVSLSRSQNRASLSKSQNRASLSHTGPSDVQKHDSPDRRGHILQKRTKWAPTKQLPVSLFGKAARFGVKAKREEGALPQAPSNGATLAVGRPITFSTASRFGANSAIAADAGPDPASYKPKPVRPHSAHARLAGKGTGPVVFHHGAVLHVSEKQQGDAPGGGKENPPIRIESSIDPYFAVSFTKSSRFDTSDEKLLAKQSPGPAAYHVGGNNLGKRRQANVYATSLKMTGRDLRTVVSNNSMFYATNNQAPTPGVGEYKVNTSSITPSTAVSFGKAARISSPTKRDETPRNASPSKRSAARVLPYSKGSQPNQTKAPSGSEEGEAAQPWYVLHRKGLDEGSPEAPPSEEQDAATKQRNQRRYESPTRGGLDRHTISARIGVNPTQQFGKSKARREFSNVRGQVVYNLKSGATAAPGVGAYEVKDGLSVGERITPRRPQSARTIGSSRRFDYEGGSKSEENTVPGPGAYANTQRSQFDNFSFNRHIRGNQKTTTVRSQQAAAGQRSSSPERSEGRA